MADFTLNTVNGPIAIDALGKTLMHEHLVVGFSGWESDTGVYPASRREIVARCVDTVQELIDNGFSSLLDPCPNDLGRDVELMGEVASRTGFNILFATGLYDEIYGSSYWKTKVAFDPDAESYIRDMYVREITEGIGATGSKPAVIKIATGPAPFPDYELTVMRAAAAAAQITGVPITTHTAAVDGDKQVAYLTEHGMRPEQLIIGHSCGSNDHAYHTDICNAGAYIGFDRFGLTMANSDEARIEGLKAVLDRGHERSVIISHDCTFHMQGQVVSKVAQDELLAVKPMHFTRVIAPQLLSLGVEAATIEAMLIDNPRSYFSGRSPLVDAHARA